MSDMGRYDELGRWVGYTRVTPDQLARAAEAEHQRILAAVAEREQREAEQRAEQAAAEQAAGQAELARYEADARAAWLSSGGSAAEFSASWPKLKQEYLQDQARDRLSRHERQVAQETAVLRASGRYSL